MPYNQKPLILGLSIAFPVVATTAVILRFEARRVKRLRLGADDWTILAALILTIAISLDVLLASRLGDLGGAGTFSPDGAPVFNSEYVVFGKTTYILEVLAWPCAGLNKISILLLYKRIFVTRGFRTVVWYFIGVVIAWTIAFTFALIFSCWPITSQWDPYIPYTCVDAVKLFTVGLVTDVLTDALIVLLPVYKVWQLQLPTHRKLAVIGNFLLGGLVTITGIIRLHYLSLTYAAIKKSRFGDIDYLECPTFYWSIIELNTGILGACIPTLRPLYEGYRLNTAVGRVISRVSGMKSAIRSTDTIRLRSIGRDHIDDRQSAVGMNGNDPYVVVDDSEAGELKSKCIKNAAL